MSTNISIALAILGCSATLAVAQEFNMKPGLWELTVTRETKGDPTSMMSAAEKAEMEEARARMSRELEEAKARMSPEQRAQMEALMKMKQPGMFGGPANTSIEKQCVTKENIHKTLVYFSRRDSAEEKETSNCKMTVLKSTATVIERREVCSSTNGQNSNTMLLFEAPNPETLTFRFEMSGGCFVMKGKSSGTWLGSACGDVKPAR
jgi:hypothetical protein